MSGPAQPQHSAHAASGKLPLGVKIGYGIGDIGGNLYFTMIGTFLLFYFTDVLDINPALAGWAFAIGKIWDAVSDPAMGYISDHAKTRWGRRRPFILLGGVLLLGTMVLMFFDPGFEHELSLFVYVSVAFVLVNTAYTITNVPYSAIVPELTSDYDERTVINGFRNVFAVVGTFTAFVLVPVVVDAFGGGDYAWTMMALVMGGVMFLSALITFVTVPEPDITLAPSQDNVIKQYVDVLKMKEYLTVLFPWTLHIAGITFLQASLIYYFNNIYRQPGLLETALATLLFSALVFIPLWVMIAKRIGKKLTYNIGMSVFATAVILFFFLGEPLGPVYAYVTMAIAGIGLATQYVMPYSLVADVVELDFANTGARREGVFFGLFTLVSKAGQGLAGLVSGLVLAAGNYVSPPEGVDFIPQAESAVFAIKLLTGPIPAVCFIIGVVVLSFYPITAQAYAEIRRRVEAREENV